MSPRHTSRLPMRKSPTAKHMGAEPSQQPPLWWNSSAPCLARNWSTTARAASVMASRSQNSVMPKPTSEEAHFFLGVGNQHVFGVAVMVQHNMVVFTADTGFLVAAKG